MNILIQLDEWLLDVIKKFARFMYLWTGIGNIRLGEMCIYLGTAIRVFIVIISIVQHKYGLVLMDIMLISGGMYLLILPKPTCSHYTYNRLRFKARNLRIVAIFFLPFLAYIFLLIERGILGYLEVTSFFLAFLLPIYFFSIEPEPPSDSKIKKMIKKIAIRFKNNPIPQPA